MREAVRSGRKANFYITENSFIDHYAREVGPVGIAVYHVLERHMNCETRSTWIGTAKMADLLNLSQRTIQRTLKTLEDLKLIRILRTEKLTTYVIVPVPPRAKHGTIPLFDQIDAAYSEHSSSAENGLFTNATRMSPFATPLSHSATQASFATTSASQPTTHPSRTRDTRDALYKEEQNLVNKSLEQEGKSSPSLQNSTRKIIAMLGLPLTDSNRRMIEAAIVAETSYTGQSSEESAELIAKCAIHDREQRNTQSTSFILKTRNGVTPGGKMADLAKPSKENSITLKSTPASSSASAISLELLSWISDQLTMLAEAFGEPLTEERMEIYARSLADIPQDQLRISFQHALNQLTWFPKLVELRRLAGADTESEKKIEADAAWVHVNDYLRKWGVDLLPIYSGGNKTTPPPLDPQHRICPYAESVDSVPLIRWT